MYIPFISEPVVAADFSSISLSIPPVLGTAFSPATWLWLSTVFHSVRFAFLSSSTTASVPPASSPNDNRVLILGGGVAGLHAAQTLHQQGVDDFIIIEARTELGGRMKNFTFGASGREYVLEAGANWIHGTQTGDGPTNPIYKLAQKHNLTMQQSDYFGSMSMSPTSRHLRMGADKMKQQHMITREKSTIWTSFTKLWTRMSN